MEWSGIFVPKSTLLKHRIGSGDITNHIEIQSKEVIEPNEPSQEETGEPMDKSDDTVYWRIEFGFIEGKGGYTFEYEHDSEEEPDNQVLIETIVREIL